MVAVGNLTQLLSTLITAGHVLHYHNILDAYGHISVRNPNNVSNFFLSRNLAPALVSSPDDIVEYRVDDASAVDPAAPGGFIERFIHSEAYKQYPTVNSVLHSHTDEVIPFGVTLVPLLPVDQAGSVLVENAPVFDIANYYLPSDPQVFLVNNARFGAALASFFSSTNSSTPNNNVMLMRGHGMAVIGPDIVTTVFRAINTRKAAVHQKDAIILAALAGPDGQPGGGGRIQYLSDEERRDMIAAGTAAFSGRGWELWVREVEAARSGELYQNSLGSPI